MTTNAKAHRRSLKECLKTILQRHRDDQHDDLLTVGFGTLKRRDPSLALLPAFSSLTSLPNFQSSRFDIDQYSVSDPDPCDRAPPRIWAAHHSQDGIVPKARPTPSLAQRDIHDAYQYQAQLGRLAKSCIVEPDWYSEKVPGAYSDASLDDINPTWTENLTRRGTLLPDASVNRMITPDSIHFKSPLSQLAHACNVPSIYRHGASLQASLATLQSPMQSASTLRLQRSTQDLKPIRASNPAPQSKWNASMSPPVGLSQVSDTSKKRVSQKQLSRHLTLPQGDDVSTSRPARTQRASEIEAGLSSIDHFSSFCVLDAATSGCPVTATSEDLRFVFDIGEQFCLNTAAVDGPSMETVTGQDDDGNVRIHLIVYNPLVNPNSGRSRFVLASLLDITSFITDAASVPDLETISEESVIEEELRTPTRFQVQLSPRYKLAAETLFEGCLLPGHNLHSPIQARKDDIWLDIASEETRKSRWVKSAPSTPRSTSSARSSTRSMDDVLDQFLVSLQDLYSDFFLLGKSALDEDSYEICNVSPRVHAAREYLEGHLTKTSPEDKARLEEQLTQEKSFRVRVRWGVVGMLKQLYCIPLFGRSNITWVCFLIEEGKWAGLPLWDDG